MSNPNLPAGLPSSIIFWSRWMVASQLQKITATVQSADMTVLLMVDLLFERGGIVTKVANVTNVAAVVL
jgi:hypothetical protein